MARTFQSRTDAAVSLEFRGGFDTTVNSLRQASIRSKAIVTEHANGFGQRYKELGFAKASLNWMANLEIWSAIIRLSFAIGNVDHSIKHILIY